MSRITGDAPLVRVSVVIGWLIAGALLLAAGGVRWVSTGPGSRFRGLELADNLRNGVLSPDWGVWVAASVYSIVGVGGALIATSALVHPAVVAVRALVSVVGLAVFIVFGWVVLPIDNWAAGPTIATLAFLIATVLSAVQLIKPSRN